MTFEERVSALAPLGLTPRQTRFLALVVLHSGYCVRRQYLAYAGVRYGKNVREFLDGLVHRRLALRLMFRADRGHVYHLYARTVYRAVGQEENRNRRVASPALIARRLMLLDYALSEPDVEWAATEDDKVTLFTTRFGVPVAALPQHRFDAGQQEGQPTLRYFLHKLPIFLPSNADVPHFVYLAADGSLSAFERFLRDHRPLFAQLTQWVVVCLQPNAAQVDNPYQATFDRFLTGAPGGHQADHLDRYFTLRRIVETGRLEDLTVADLHDYRAARRRFSAPEVERAYAAWPGSGGASPATAFAGGGRLVMRTLPHPYQQFGTMAGVA